MPRPGDVIYIDLGRPDEEEWVVEQISWDTSGPPHIVLQPVIGEELPDDAYHGSLDAQGLERSIEASDLLRCGRRRVSELKAP